MTHHRTIITRLLAHSSVVMLIVGSSITAYAEQTAVLSGKVTEILNVTGYTYAEVNLGKKKVWAAGPVTPLKVGDTVSFSPGMPMKDFHSKSMKRDFSVIYFVDRFITGNKSAAGESVGMPTPHDKIKKKAAAAPLKGIKKVKGGHSISDIYARKNSLNGKTVRVRGKVTKVTTNVMNKNWLHIRDSSTLDDLTVTTNDIANIGDVVIVEGKIALDKDYSYGYVYPVIMLDAKIKKQ
jgi:hypothetical protein